jgi:hypothetical protein
LVITEPKEQLFACYRNGWYLTQSGKEVVRISRGGTSEVSHSYSYQTPTGCNPTVIVTLPDGRALPINP